jgi:hypothetical protein
MRSIQAIHDCLMQMGTQRVFSDSERQDIGEASQRLQCVLDRWEEVVVVPKDNHLLRIAGLLLAVVSCACVAFFMF